MLFTCEEKEIPYPVGLVIFTGEEEKTPMSPTALELAL